MNDEEQLIKFALRVLASDYIQDMLEARGINAGAASDDAADLYRSRYDEDLGANTFTTKGLREHGYPPRREAQPDPSENDMAALLPLLQPMTTQSNQENQMTTTPEPKTRTITLTDRPPVRIVESYWPVIAEASGDSWAGHPGDSRYHQALNQGQLDRWTITVRQHKDGRTLVYATFTAATSPGVDLRGGELIDPEPDRIDFPERYAQLPNWIVAAIHRVGESCGLPDHTIWECMADLPPVDL